jgi:hypothetical protein
MKKSHKKIATLSKDLIYGILTNLDSKAAPATLKERLPTTIKTDNLDQYLLRLDLNGYIQVVETRPLRHPKDEEIKDISAATATYYQRTQKGNLYIEAYNKLQKEYEQASKDVDYS